MITDRDPEFVDTITVLYREELGRVPNPGGLASWLEHCRQGMTGAQLRAALHDSPEGVAYRTRPQVMPASLPTVQGIDFVRNGQRVSLNGCDQFRAYRMFLNGQDLSPLFDESHAIGFTLWRVFLMGSVAQNGLLDLRPSDRGYDDHLRPFADLLNQHGIILLATVFVDAQDIMRSASGRAAHWAAIADRLRGTATILSYANEAPKNGADPREATDPGMLWSRGSGLSDEAPFQPTGSVMEFHPRRDLPAALMDAVASAVFIHARDQKPLIIDEPPRFGTDGSGQEYADPALCWKFARHYATECAGAIFHSRAGQKGVVMDPVTRACAVAWSNGMRL